ncbi:MAG TPA: SGNH/GDSL hydrolase family protein [Terracidiphilus sp.]|nr:SGNH/GDSL hydrolase family protein [Terracidiphilus sp.]
MPKHRPVPALILVLFLALGMDAAAQQAGRVQWVGTWVASPMLASGGWKVKPFSNVTLREVAHISAGGSQIRLRLTNEFGTDPLTIDDAHVALSAGGSAIKEGTDHAITFGGASTVVIPPGAAMMSDPVSLSVEPLTDLAVSFHIPSQVMRAETFHDFADQDNYMADGDVAGATDLAQPAKLSSWYFFDGVDVRAGADSRAILTFGDSITDGAHSTENANRRWPDYLAARLQGDSTLKNASVLNEGIGGNRVLNDVYGPNALARMDRDLISQHGVCYAIVLEGINDIGRWARLAGPEDEVTALQLEHGLTQIADAAHEHGIRIFGATLTPYEGAGYYSEKGEQIREQVNDWIRSSGTFDGVIDFDRITRDPANPRRFLPAYDSGDHLHPGDEGYKAMAAGIDLALFAR